MGDLSARLNFIVEDEEFQMGRKNLEDAHELIALVAGTEAALVNARVRLTALQEALAAAEAAHDELEMQVEDEIRRRDLFEEAITATHVALGGDGEWRAHVGGAPEPPDSGHLHLDVPVMAGEQCKALAAARAELAEAVDLCEFIESHASTLRHFGYGRIVSMARALLARHTPEEASYDRELPERPEDQTPGAKLSLEADRLTMPMRRDEDGTLRGEVGGE